MQNNFWKKIKSPVMALAPMSGVTDESFRLMLLKFGRPDVFWTEFVSADGLFSKGKDYCLGLLRFSDKERPIVAQLFGGNPDYFEKAAKVVAELGFDGIDINMGCPDSDIEKRDGGAALIRNPALAKKIIRATKKGAGKIPVSVKTRIGYDKNEIAKWVPELLKENIAALTVHFRTRNEMYRAKAHWELAKEIVKLRDKYAPETLILGNGDVESLPEARKLVKETGLDGIMIGRGILKNPWLFSERAPSVQERLDAVLEHAEIFESKNFDAIKKYFHAYVKNFKGAKELRDKLMKTKNKIEVKKITRDFLKK
jgi:nifR3 family TIM-barrel protein